MLFLATFACQIKITYYSIRIIRVNDVACSNARTCVQTNYLNQTYFVIGNGKRVSDGFVKTISVRHEDKVEDDESCCFRKYPCLPLKPCLLRRRSVFLITRVELPLLLEHWNMVVFKLIVHHYLFQLHERLQKYRQSFIKLVVENLTLSKRSEFFIVWTIRFCSPAAATKLISLHRG